MEYKQKQKLFSLLLFFINFSIIMLLAWLPTLYFETSLSWWVVGIISKIVLIVLNKLILGIEGEGDIWDAAQVTVLERKHGVNKLGADVGNIIIVVILFGLLNLIYWGF